MERFGQLAKDLIRQLEEGASPAQLHQTVALLSLELEKEAGNTHRPLGTAKVAVVLPQTPVSIQLSDKPEAAALAPLPVETPPPVTTPAPTKTKSKPKPAPLVLFDEEFTVEPLTASEPDKKESLPASTFDVMEEVPTLYMQRETEINERLQSGVPSLNDQMIPDSVARQQILQEGPISDLRKAIGINERFQFIRELFRNDEAMYERSIKTINQFQVYAEADFWVNRELKTKLGWPIDHPLVQSFDQLIKRRFS